MRQLAIVLSLLALLALGVVGQVRAEQPELEQTGERVVLEYSSSGCQLDEHEEADTGQRGPSRPEGQVLRYSFSDDLQIEFTVLANCCPDSNRFKITSWSESNHLYVAVADTAPSLCRCVCPYVVSVQFLDLPEDGYFIEAVPSDDGQELFPSTLVTRGTFGESMLGADLFD